MAFYLHLKQEYAQEAGKIYKAKIQQITDPDDQYETIPYVTSFIRIFFDFITDATNRTVEYVKEYIEKNMLKYDFQQQKQSMSIYYIQENIFNDYKKKLQEISDMYIKQIVFFCNDLYNYLEDCYLPLNISESKCSLGETKLTLSNFLTRTAKLLNDGLNEHFNILQKSNEIINDIKNSGHELYMIKHEQYARLYTVDSRYINLYKKIIQSIKKLREIIEKTPPILIRTEPLEDRKEFLYPERDEISSKVYCCKQLYQSFFEKLCELLGDEKNVFEVIQSYMNANIGYIVNGLLPE